MLQVKLSCGCEYTYTYEDHYGGGVIPDIQWKDHQFGHTIPMAVPKRPIPEPLDLQQFIRYVNHHMDMRRLVGSEEQVIHIEAAEEF